MVYKYKILRLSTETLIFGRYTYMTTTSKDIGISQVVNTS